MKTLNIELNLYSINELSDNAKRKAIEDHRSFLLSIMQPDDFISGIPEYDTKQELQKQYEENQEYYLFNDDPVIDSIQINDYLFYIDGTLADMHKTNGNDNVITFYGNDFHF